MNKNNRATKLPQKIYNLPTCTAMMVVESEPNYMIQCPKCEKRVIDVYEMPKSMIKLRYKCPHCKNVIIMPLAPIEDYSEINDST